MADAACQTLKGIMEEIPDQQPDGKPKRRYVWPWFVLAAVLLAILLAILWMSHEIARTRRIRELNSSVSAPP